MTEQLPPEIDMQRALEIELESRLNIGGFDMDKMADVVNLIWQNRDKIMGTVDTVRDNWDDIMDTVDVVMRNREAFLGVLEWARRHSARLVDLADSLPDLLHKTGDGIEAAGVSARQAGRFLAGSKEDDATSASELMDLAATALESCRGELEKAAGLLSVLGDEIDDIRIPHLSPRFVEVMGVRVVSGVEVGESNLMDTAAKRLKGGAARLAQVGVDLENVAGKMRNLGGQLTEAGTDLGRVGDQLSGSGDLLRSLSLLDLGPAEEEIAITVEIPGREYAASGLDVTRGDAPLDLDAAPAPPSKKPRTSKKSTSTAQPAKPSASKTSSSKSPTTKASATKASATKSATKKAGKTKSTASAKSKSASSKSASSKSSAKSSAKSTSGKKTTSAKGSTKASSKSSAK